MSRKLRAVEAAVEKTAALLKARRSDKTPEGVHPAHSPRVIKMWFGAKALVDLGFHVCCRGQVAVGMVLSVFHRNVKEE